MSLTTPRTTVSWLKLHLNLLLSPSCSWSKRTKHTFSSTTLSSRRSNSSLKIQLFGTKHSTRLTFRQCQERSGSIGFTSRKNVWLATSTTWSHTPTPIFSLCLHLNNSPILKPKCVLHSALSLFSQHSNGTSLSKSWKGNTDHGTTACKKTEKRKKLKGLQLMVRAVSQRMRRKRRENELLINLIFWLSN